MYETSREWLESREAEKMPDMGILVRSSATAAPTERSRVDLTETHLTASRAEIQKEQSPPRTRLGNITSCCRENLLDPWEA